MSAPKLYESPLSLPEKTIGKFSIVHRELRGKVPLVDMREAVTAGRPPVFVELSKPRRLHELYDADRGVWMTDDPRELRQMAEFIDDFPPPNMRQPVLVGGLGLAILPSILADAGLRVVVVEREREIVELVQSQLDRFPNIEIVIDDIGRYLRTVERWPFQAAYLDTWQGTNEGTWWSEVFPLRRTIANRFGAHQRVACWAEPMMLGQIRRTLRLGNRTWHYSGLPLPMSSKAVDGFLTSVGSPHWERKYGKLYPREEVAA